MKRFFFLIIAISSNLVFAQVHTEYYENGSKRCEGEYLNATKSIKLTYASDGSSRPDPTLLKTGNWKYWYDNGIQSADEHYNQSGLPDETWKSWYTNGNLSSEINYSTQNAVYFYLSGQKKSEGKILNNSARDGQWLFYNETGILSGDALYKNGLKVGTWHYFDAATGKEVRSEEYNNDLLIQTK